MQNIHVPIVGTVNGLAMANAINTGLDSLQQNIGGVLSKSVAGGSDVALSTAEANNGVISLTGAITANINVVVPTSSMQWIFQNATSGAFSITVKTAAGSGVVLPQGSSDKLYCDGANVLFAKSGIDGAITALIALASINSGPLGFMRQKLIGGNFTDNPWQRGTTFTFSTSGQYVADRWRVDFDGSANITVDKVALGTAQVINGVWCRHGLRFTVNSKSGNSFIRLSQRIEGVDTLTTLPSTLQTVIQGSGAFTVPVAARQNFGTGGSPSADVVTSFSSSLAVTASQQQLTTGLTIPSIAGKTLGSNIDNFLAVEYDLMAVPAAGYVVIPLAGLEPGTVLSAYYEKRGPALELALCQRYLPVIKGGGNGIFTGNAISTTHAFVALPFKTVARANPTGVTALTPTGHSLYDATGNGLSVTAVAFLGASVDSGFIDVTVASGLAAGNATSLITSGGSMAFTGCEL